MQFANRREQRSLSLALSPIVRALGVVVLLVAPAATPTFATTVGFWQFDQDGPSAGQAATTILDSSGNNHHGSAVQSPTYSSDVPATPGSPSNNALSLDFERNNFSGGLGEAVVVPHSSSLSFGNSSYTLEGWVKLETLTGLTGQRQFLFLKKDVVQADTKLEYGLMANLNNYTPQFGKTTGVTGNELTLLLGDGTTFRTVVSELQVNDNNWHHVSAAFDAANDQVRFTLDGRLDFVSGVTFNPVANNHPLQIGRHPTGVNSGTQLDYSDGKLDELRISQGVLPLEQLLIEFAPHVWATHNYEASAAGNTNLLWQDTIGNKDWTHGNSNPPTLAPASSGQFLIDTAYQFDGTADNGFTASEFAEGGASQRTASFEMWFKPADFTGQELLFETGGHSKGLSLTLNNALLQFATKNGTLVTAPHLLAHDLSALGVNDFIQVVGVVDEANNETRLYVNGVLVETLAGTDDWLGADDASLGSLFSDVGASTSGNLLPDDPFAGQIAIFRHYNGLALSDNQVGLLFSAMTATVPEPSSLLLTAIGGVIAGWGVRRRRRTV